MCLKLEYIIVNVMRLHQYTVCMKFQFFSGILLESIIGASKLNLKNKLCS